MAQDIQTNNQEYNFESQLQLGELLLGLGRSREALSELNKAKELRDIGAAGEAVDTAQFRLASRRLDAALEKASALSMQNRWRNNIGWIIATIALVGLAGFAFLQLTLNRSDVIEAELRVTSAAALVETKAFELNLALMENTRTVQEIVNQKYQIATVAADNTRIYDIVTARDRLEEAEAVITESALTAEALISSIENLTPGAPRTVGSGQMSASLFDEDRPSLTLIEPRELELLVSSVNMRAGPSTRSPVIRYAIQGESLVVLGTNQAGTWFKVMGENENDVGWIAAYLTQVDSPETLPTAIAIPTIPPEEQNDSPRDAEEIYVELTEVYSIQATAVKELETIFTELLTPTATPSATPTPTPTPSENLDPTPETANPNEPLPVLGPIGEDGEDSEEEESNDEE